MAFPAVFFCLLCDPPQAENPAKQDSFLYDIEKSNHTKEKKDTGGTDNGERQK